MIPFCSAARCVRCQLIRGKCFAASTAGAGGLSGSAASSGIGNLALYFMRDVVAPAYDRLMFLKVSYHRRRPLC